MKKAFFASFCSLTAIACALWLFLYTIINDLMRSPFGEGALIWELRLFGPMVIFTLCCLGYVRIRRSMDKEKSAAQKRAEDSLNELMLIAPNELTARALLDLLPEGKLTEERIGSELTSVLDELRFTYYRFYRQGGNKNHVAISMLELLDRLDRDMPRGSFDKK